MTATTPNPALAREELRTRLMEARAETDRLFQLVRPDAMYERPIAERHRIVFYFGHLEAFDWNLLHERALAVPSFHPEFDQLFAFGIDPVGGGAPDDQAADWPSLREVAEYNERVREALDARLGDLAGEQTELLLNVAIEHRLMHAETLAYMLHRLLFEQKISPGLHGPVTTDGPPAPEMIEIPAGIATLGAPRDGTFGWDNEFESRLLEVAAFEIDKYMVTNGQYLEFINDGGYGWPELWASSDWEWRTSSDVTHPVFWRHTYEGWKFRRMFDEIPLPFDWPVYVSHAEASAYARWAGKALPTEAEWHRAAYGTQQGSELYYPWGEAPPAARHGNFNFGRWEPLPVNACPAGRSAFGLHGLLGNGWEWTSSLFEPHPGFEAFPFYPGYSANFFDGKHYVMKGGSSRTASSMLRRPFRNWFQPHYQYVYAGFRCVNR